MRFSFVILEVVMTCAIQSARSAVVNVVVSAGWRNNFKAKNKQQEIAYVVIMLRSATFLLKLSWRASCALDLSPKIQSPVSRWFLSCCILRTKTATNASDGVETVS